MALTNYTTLQAAIASWLHDDSLTSQIPDFITLGEIEIFQRLRVRAMETAGTLSCVAGTATIALPSNFRAFKWLYVAGNPKRKLEYASGEQLHDTYAGSSTAKPQVFSYQGDNLLLGPTPDSAYTISYLAYIAPTALSGSTATNTLFPRYANLYLFAALMEAYDFLEDDDQRTKYERKLERGIQKAMVEDLMDRHSGSTLRARSSGANP